jgi:hypothetical protein
MSIKKHHLITIHDTDGLMREMVSLSMEKAEYSTLRDNYTTYTATLIAGERLGSLRHYHGGDNRPRAGWVGFDTEGIESPKFRTRREALAWFLDQREAAAEAAGHDLTAEDYLEDEDERVGRENRIRYGIRTAEGEQAELLRTARLTRQSARFHLGETKRYLADDQVGYARMHARFAANHAAKLPNDPISQQAATEAAQLADDAAKARIAEHEQLLADSRATRAEITARTEAATL